MFLATLPLLLFLAGFAVVRSAVPAILCRAHPWNARARGFEACRRALLVLVALALLALAWTRVVAPDWHYHFWSMQFPMLAFALGSGVLLVEVWRGDRVALWGDFGRRRRGGAWVFLGGLVVLWATGFVLQLLVPHPHSSPYSSGDPVGGLWQLVRYGFGGPLPVDLAPITELERARGIGHLPREVTVPAAAGLLAAWLWIGFACLALAVRWMGDRIRPFVPLLPALLLLGVQAMWMADMGPIGPFDPGLFSVEADHISGVWRSDPVQMTGFGPVLAFAAFLALLLAWIEWRAARFEAPAVAVSGPPVGA